MSKLNLSLYDSRQHKVVPFVALDPLHVRLYFCGPTVYDFLHIGNLRAMLTADILVRTLRSLYPKVTYVRNITDVDDKINARAKLNNESIQSLTQRTTQDFHQDMQSMYILPPDVEPRATEHINDIQQMISQLIENGHAYAAEGHVLFSVPSYKDYGHLSGRNPEELIAGARVEVATYKKHPGDFVLWKPSNDDEPGWDSPWGKGRPGWHIECSAMSYRYLGESFDIHGGGHDLLFPHHENECAQSLCCFPESQFANIWVHNAMLLVDGEKMSKSLGNFFTIREILAQHNPEAIRFALLQAHYRSVLNFSQAGLKEAKQIMDRFYRALSAFESDLDQTDDLPEAFTEAMSDDLNTPKALMVMHQLADQALKGNKEAATQLKSAGQQLGLFNTIPSKWFQNTDKAQQIEALIEQRNTAKKARDFTTADRIRDELKDQGIVLEDSPNGTIWRQI
ncbi:Cysteinyl-tRNA synthetase (CysS) (PDB:1LI5) [Commensalibacter communis]|uniref:Cysteine--tRNA ligase n=1 Tax=Commensalibacter communis TaxID=2972786 RepID=A0A9W4XCU1_9PROT|nr:cysteine--tRNA ligase [Commensalibacter communis]CAI3926408.1 Cysteinyl-tRNA synthetase (CysS) (PDB:1LI5) [Commensalibacter communis]CAI3926988.1 Cysteinyl-tRNA synthetase (CysS) (PDB:1LI5) [Commensalibacter communis]CAI3934453.1 Cysteinyl-tRNA synthetase (CysS) (PDB:1LI5) [Commensalibacter communis]CAI3936046.1 Cysteinyl-tRNA synthetase (CysS) (PDB:1LI5) [Commensalibacter communis]CAI3939086.1 Cysteinyl-tRNA synthetase (CysS) (PDB:1LI5) [Commensalibacter communis]